MIRNYRLTVGARHSGHLCNRKTTERLRRQIDLDSTPMTNWLVAVQRMREAGPRRGFDVNNRVDV